MPYRDLTSEELLCVVEIFVPIFTRELKACPNKNPLYSSLSYCRWNEYLQLTKLVLFNQAMSALCSSLKALACQRLLIYQCVFATMII